MEKYGTKTRDIQFFSSKNHKVVCVHTSAARQYARYLEEQPWVAEYEAAKPLDKSFYVHVDPIGIRSNYFDTNWATDFIIQCADGRLQIREITSTASLTKRATIERLEFSRRYWHAKDVEDWKVVLMGESVGE